VQSNSQQLFAERCQNYLLPSHTYGIVSGGDPAYIPDLSWDKLKEFHAHYYHPSNARYANSPNNIVYLTNGTTYLSIIDIFELLFAMALLWSWLQSKALLWWMVNKWWFTVDMTLHLIFVKKIGEGMAGFWPPSERVLTFGLPVYGVKFRQNSVRFATIGEVTDRQKDRHTDASDFVICPMLCYSNGTDNYAESFFSAISVDFAVDITSTTCNKRFSAILGFTLTEVFHWNAIWSTSMTECWVGFSLYLPRHRFPVSGGGKHR